MSDSNRFALISVITFSILVLSKNEFDATGHQRLVQPQGSAPAADWSGGNDDGPRQYPVTIHDASNIFFGNTDTYSSRFPGTSCADSIMLQLSDPSLKVSRFAAIACKVAATTSDLIFERR